MRRQRGERTEVLRPESRFREAADVWMGKIRERREDSTADTYASCLQNQVLPQLGELRLVECDVAHLDAFFSRLERARKVVQQADGSTVEKPQLAANTRRMVRAIVGGIMQQAVLHQAVAVNPVRDLERIESPKGHRKAFDTGGRATSRRGAERRVLEHPWSVLDYLDAAIECTVTADHVEGDVWVAVVDTFRSGGAGDHREHADPEPVDESGLKKEPRATG